MHPKIRTSVEKPRGCGYRKKGGVYLIADGEMRPCGRLPIPLTCCPTCHQGIHPARGWTWIDGAAILEHSDARCRSARPIDCGTCPMGGRALEPYDKVGLLWIGSKFYPRPADFLLEAAEMGVSRRLKSVPLDFKLGETWVWLAHRQAVRGEPAEDGTATWHPGVFHAFRPARLEVVVDGTEPDEEIEALLERGLSPVKVIRDAAPANN